MTSNAMRNANEWLSSQEIPTDVTVLVGGAKFSLHKFPLVSKSGYIRRLVAEAKDSNLSLVELPDIPGGTEAFDLAVKFCYGITFEISTTNIAMLRCAAEYLEMTEDYANGNLVSRTEDYINEVALKNLSSAVTVLHLCENLLPMAEDLKIVSRCINIVASKACKDSQFGLSNWIVSQENVSSTNSQTKPMIDWWAEELVVLRIDFYQRVLTAMKARGLKYDSLGVALMFYAQKSLRALDIFWRSREKIEHKKEYEERILIETIVSLLPTERNTMSVSFLCSLLRAAIYLETTVACRLDLEQRIGLQLEQATLDDLLIPSFSYSGDTLLDVDTVRRITVNFLERDKNGDLDTIHFLSDTDDGHFSPATTALMKVAKLLDIFLAEIAPDANLSIVKFTGLAELIPEEARAVDDGLYRAIDIYLKAHPSLNEEERKRVCSVMDCQKLSREACAHAAQNERLPLHVVVQVLYFEQQRLRHAAPGTFIEGDIGQRSQRMNISEAASASHSPQDELSALRRENQELKLQMAKMQMRLHELEKNTATGMKAAAGKPPQPTEKASQSKKTFLNSVSEKLGKLNLLMKPFDSTIRAKPAKTRRHSIS